MRLMVDNPEDPAAMHFMAYIFMNTDKIPLAYNLYKSVVAKKPDQVSTFLNLGHCAYELRRFDEAMACFQQVIKNDPKYAMGYANISATLVSQKDYINAEKYAREALVLDPNNVLAKMNLGIALLAQQKWDEGFKMYEFSLGSKQRKEYEYGDKGRWRGEPGTVAVHGEQGLGDEIMFASCVPDACEKADIILDIDPRLVNLFKRSFPKAKVYGTRRDVDLEWLDDTTVDYRSALGSLPIIFRKKTEDFPGTPFLKADPARVKQWKTISDKPIIGIAWSGGIFRTNMAGRTIPLEAFKPLFDMFDATWVSLQYRTPTEDISPVTHYKRATETDDYDDAAGLIAACDFVIGVHTAALHTAGGLGVPTLCLVPEQGAWPYGGKTMPWYGSMELFKQRRSESWDETIKRLTLSNSSWFRQARERCVPRLLPISDQQDESPGKLHATGA